MRPSYSQRDPQWANILLGFNTSSAYTIGTAGCYMTAIANICYWAGKVITPQQVNDLCKQYNAFRDGGILTLDDVPSRICSNLHFAGRTNWSGPTPMSFFADASDTHVGYIIEIDSSSAPGVQTHFVFVWGKSGDNDLQIIDSWDGQLKLLSHYGSPSAVIQSAIKFTKDAEAAAPPPPAAPVEQPVVQPAPESVPAQAPPLATPIDMPPPAEAPIDAPSVPVLTTPAASEPVVSIQSKLPPLVGAFLRFLARLFFPGAR